jgi:hypothetical protein
MIVHGTVGQRRARTIRDTGRMNTGNPIPIPKSRINRKTAIFPTEGRARFEMGADDAICLLVRWRFNMVVKTVPLHCVK